jgi:hypothetical protein
MVHLLERLNATPVCVQLRAIATAPAAAFIGNNVLYQGVMSESTRRPSERTGIENNLVPYRRAQPQKIAAANLDSGELPVAHHNFSTWLRQTRDVPEIAPKPQILNAQNTA